MRRLIQLLAVLIAATPLLARAQAPAAPDPLAIDQPEVVFTHVTLVDGTGRPAQRDMTVTVADGRIVSVEPSNKYRPSTCVMVESGPYTVDEAYRKFKSEEHVSVCTAVVSNGDAENSVSLRGGRERVVIDGTGKTLLPGFVMMHEHMFYPTGRRNYTEMLSSFPKLYLAGGTTTMRTAGSMNPYADLNLREEINAGRALGPDLDVTGPYLNGPGLPILKVHPLKDADDAVRTVNYWSDEGVTSFKGYMQLTRAEMAAITATAHKRGRKVTAHLCSITYHEAIEAGIDNLEHGFFVASDFVKDKQPDVCPAGDAVLKSQAALDPDGPEATALIHDLIDHHVALTSTLTVFETFVAGRPEADARTLSVLLPQIRDQYVAGWTRVQTQTTSPWVVVFPKLMRMEKRFVDMGGFLMAGTDPTGYGGVVPGFASKREIELLVEAGFPFEKAVEIATLNGARFEGRDKDIGSIEVGKRADLVLIDGDPIKDPRAIERMPLVFKAGKGYRTDVIIDGMKDTVGLY
jgi:imidazolonepropionase-like amidohydrolase